MGTRGPKPLGKTAKIYFELYPQLEVAIRRASEESGIGLGDFISACLAKELNVPIPAPKPKKNPDQMELADV